MINAFKIIRPLPSGIARKVTGFSFATASDQQKMDKNKKPENTNEKTGGAGTSCRIRLEKDTLQGLMKKGLGEPMEEIKLFERIKRSMRITLITTKLKVAKQRRKRKVGTRRNHTGK